MSGKKIALLLMIILVLCGGIIFWVQTRGKPTENPVSSPVPMDKNWSKSPNESPPGKLIATIGPHSFMMHTLTISPDNRRVAFWEKRDGKQYVIVNDKKGKEYKEHLINCEIIFSPDSKRVAYIVKEDKGEFAVIDGKVGKKYSAISREYVYFSPDSSRTAYAAVKEKNKWAAVVDGKEGKELYGIVGDISFSPDSKKVIYISRDIKYMHPVINGKELGDFAGVRQKITLSPDSKRTAYFARGMDYKSVILDGKKIRKYKVSFFLNKNSILKWNELLKKLKKHDSLPVKRVWDILDKKSKDAINAWQPGQTPDKKLKSTVLNGLNEVIRKKNFYRKKDFEGIKFYHTLVKKQVWARVDRLSELRITHFNRQLLYRVFPGEIASLYIDSKEYGLIFSPDSKRLAYLFKLGKWFVDVDGKEHEKYEDIGTLPTFSRDSKHIAYVAKEGKKEVVVVDGKEEKKYDAIGSNPLFSPDGKTIAYAAREGDKQFIVINGKEGKKYSDLVKESVVIQTNCKREVRVVKERGEEFSICCERDDKVLHLTKNAVVFSPDGSHTVYAAAENGKEFIVVDGEEQKKYDRILTFPVFSSDGKYIAYVVRENCREFVVLNGKEMRKFDDVITIGGGRVVFDSPPDSLRYLVRERNNIYLVEEATKP
ncbi:MAG: hypothetical protein K8T10_03410 [Candidatus Eremiobacteraeota bacterium]|nr:hypothetical protein [Candidatus Eremiobacteraeota bacterium]